MLVPQVREETKITSCRICGVSIIFQSTYSRRFFWPKGYLHSSGRTWVHQKSNDKSSPTSGMGRDGAGEYGTSNYRGADNFWWWRCRKQFGGKKDPKKHPTASSRRERAYQKRYRVTELQERKHERQNRKAEERKSADTRKWDVSMKDGFCGLELNGEKRQYISDLKRVIDEMK